MSTGIYRPTAAWGLQGCPLGGKFYSRCVRRPAGAAPLAETTCKHIRKTKRPWHKCQHQMQATEAVQLPTCCLHADQLPSHSWLDARCVWSPSWLRARARCV
jgi:hypothetical protein